eukprot:1157724-Pelagomonas_calceolata.AAC.6
MGFIDGVWLGEGYKRSTSMLCMTPCDAPAHEVYPASWETKMLLFLIISLSPHLQTLRDNLNFTCCPSYVEPYLTACFLGPGGLKRHHPSTFCSFPFAEP